MTDKSYDALIIGAGTAGLSAGISLKKTKSSYIIIDKKSEIGKPVRSTGAVSKYWADKLKMPVNNNIVSSEIYGISFRTDTGKKVNLNYDTPVGYVYDFTAYEKYMAYEMEGKLNVKMNTFVKEIRDNRVITEGGEYEADNVIIASGPTSNFSNLSEKSKSLVGYEETRELDARDDYQMILWFSDMAPGGYFWDFTESKNTRKIGVCYFPQQGWNPREVLKKFTEKNKELDGKVIHTMAHPIPLDEPKKTVVNGNRLFCGDMVNAVLNTTAGGLQGAFWTGREAGIAAAEKHPEHYQNEWGQNIKPWLDKHRELFLKLHKNGVKSIEHYMTISKLIPMSLKKRIFGGL